MTGGVINSGLDSDRLLQEWRWLVPSGEVKLVTPLGDLVLWIDGAYWFLNASDAGLERLASSEPELQEVLAQRTNDILAAGFVERMRREGLELAPGQCIGFAQPAVLGGAYVRSNAYAVDAYECVSFLGDLNRQIKELPDGARVQLKVK